MANLLEEIDSNAAEKRMPAAKRTILSDARRKVRVLSPPIDQVKQAVAPKKNGTTSSESHMYTPPLGTDYGDEDDGYFAGIQDDDLPTSDQQLPSSPIARVVERMHQLPVNAKENDEDEDQLMEVAQAVGHTGTETARVNMSGARPAPKIVKASYPSPDSSSPSRPPPDTMNPSTWNDVNDRLNVLSSPAIETLTSDKLAPQVFLEEDGSLRLFWLDYTELNGSLCLFGKVRNKKTGQHVSCFVKVDNILRKLFFLPREYRQRRTLLLSHFIAHLTN